MICETCNYSTDNKKSFSNHTRYGCTGTSWKERNKEHLSKYMKEYVEKNKDKIIANQKEYQPKWRKRNPEKVKENRKNTRDKLRKDVLNAYGHRCKCCGEDRHEFLAIDHINGGGNKHRKSLHPNASAQTFYTWLRRNKYPVGFQVLCHNCNSAKSYYGGCPHHKNRRKLLLSPHNDDECLFSSYKIMREKPLVIIVTHSTLQGGNGYERALESYKAMRILGVDICFLGIDEDKLTGEILKEKLIPFGLYNEVIIPSYEENGNPHHNIVNKVAKELFWKTEEYKTYTGLEDRTIGKEIIPTEKERELKMKAMACYQTQIQNKNTSHYFLTTTEYE